MFKLKTLSYFFIAFSLIACGGGGSSKKPDEDDSNSEGNGESLENVKGVLVVPENSVNLSAAKILIYNRKSAVNVCDAVPSGYLPLSLIEISFLDAEGSQVDSLTTDDCGEFQGEIDSNAILLRADVDGYKSLQADLSLFTSAEGAVASTISNDAEYEISSIQFTGLNGDQIAFSVIDSLTNKAVIGLPEDAISLTVDSVAVSLTSLTSAAQVSEPASISLVLDSSGSMFAEVFDNDSNILLDENGEEYSRFRLTALAAHTYLDSMPETDETSIVFFSSEVYLMNDDTISQHLSFNDANGDDYTYTFSTTGFTSFSEDLRLVVDAYNADSQLYGSFQPDPIHAESPDVTSSFIYPFSGVTALYDGIETALNNTNDNGVYDRKLLIAMSDGANNSSDYSIDEVILSAQEKSIPVHTIAIGSADTQELSRIAEETNASFFDVADTDLAGIFQTIQTGIIFQYLLALDSTVSEGEEVTLSLNINGVETERSIIR